MHGVILYSTNAKLSYYIAEVYYGGYHYVWCSVIFKLVRDDLNPFAAIPPSSCPFEIYKNFLVEINRRDHHGNNISRTKTGIINGAISKLEEGVINNDQHDEIIAIVNESELADYMPLIYIIPYDRVANQLCEVSVEQRAHPLSREYIIKKLARSDFDVINFEEKR